MWKTFAHRCVMSCGMSFIHMFLLYRTVLPWIAEAAGIFNLMQNVRIGAEFVSMVR